MFSKLQLNAGVVLTDFNPATGTLDKTKILGATSGGVNFTAQAEFRDDGEDIDNIPSNALELKHIDYYTVTLSGTMKTVDTAAAKALIGAATVSGEKVTPNADVASTDFADIWWVGDYSDVNTGNSAGFVAIRVLNAYSTGGFQLQSNDNGKGDFAFEFTGHYSIEDMEIHPFEVYVKAGANGSTGTTGA